MERVGEKSGNLKKYHIAKIKICSKIIKKTYTFIVIKLIIHINRYFVHAIHMPLQSETVWYQPLCMKWCYYSFCCRLMHLPFVYLAARVKKLVRENIHFVWKNQGKVRENEFCKVVGTML